MPYKNKEDLREYQRKWAERRLRKKGIPPRRKGEDLVRKKLRQSKWKYGELALAHRAVVALEHLLNVKTLETDPSDLP